MTEVIAANSTNVRASYPSASPAPAILGWLERHAPRMTLALAERVFFRPGKRHVPLDVAKADKVIDVEVEGTRIRVAGYGAGPNVVAAHGWAGGGAQFDRLRAHVVDAGFTFWTFDMPAHGATAGRSAHAGLFAEALTRVAARLGSVHAVVGHSLGATAASLAVSRGIEVSGVVLIAPMPSVDFAVEGFTRWAGLSAESRETLKRRALKRASLREEEQSLFLLSRAPARSLVIHDKDDRMVPVQQSRALERAWPGVELFETERQGHNRILKNSEVAAEVCRFLHRLPRAAVTPLDRHFASMDSMVF